MNVYVRFYEDLQETRDVPTEQTGKENTCETVGERGNKITHRMGLTVPRDKLRDGKPTRRGFNTARVVGRRVGVCVERMKDVNG